MRRWWERGCLGGGTGGTGVLDATEPAIKGKVSITPLVLLTLATAIITVIILGTLLRNGESTGTYVLVGLLCAVPAGALWAFAIRAAKNPGYLVKGDYDNDERRTSLRYAYRASNINHEHE